jgi:hypothetical protein
VEKKGEKITRVKYSESIADKLSKAAGAVRVNSLDRFLHVVF